LFRRAKHDGGGSGFQKFTTGPTHFHDRSFLVGGREMHSEHLNPIHSLAVNPHDYALSPLSIGPADPMNI